ncbi:Phage-type endonuclease [Thiomonas sp. X19]|uniref:YqaJ viral recombinase family nuclease n=1 Tax=Thiomonas sp. X19 TaxID=1050370 RepID=UPI000B70F515|nr:YqaJ viral recombinase family protein [Thiomonas sp. X19]SCC95135.1 Phage-type endonuclease [Thiomonas sp. X19]
MQHFQHPATPRPALRLVSTKALSREDWLDVRKTGIGSSDAAAAVGLNPYQSQLELWLVKTGRDSNLPKVDPNDETSPMYWGTLLEPIVAAHYVKRTGNKVRRINAVLQHPTIPWMLANIDREVLGSTEVAILECKTAGIHGARLWRDGVPEYVQLQVQHQLAVTGKAAADVAVLLGGQELQVHRIPRDEALMAHLLQLEAQFWAYVETDTPPPADGSDSAGQALQALFPQDSGATADFTGDAQLNGVFSDWLAVRVKLEQLEAQESQCKQTLQQSMGEATKAEFEAGAVTWKKSKDSLTLDTAALLKVQPELLSQYPKSRPGSRRFVLL